MTSSTSPQLNGRHAAPTQGTTSAPGAATAPAKRSETPDQRYTRVRGSLIASIPGLATVLPPEWPTEKPAIDLATTLGCLRHAAATHNEGLFILGYGDGSILEYLRQDTLSRCKLINIVILGNEARAFAHSLGVLDFQPILDQLHIGIHFVNNADELKGIILQIFGTHAQITRLAGTTIMDAHPLVPEAMRMRVELLPILAKVMVERYDCLGNDVYDTFLGARNALMHGDSLFRYLHSKDIAGRHKGKSALCIASGPSGPAHFERIRAIQHEHVVICADSILGALLENGIEPDFVTMVERPDTMHRLVDKHASACRTTLVALPVVHPSSVTPFNDRVIWWWNSDDLYPWLDRSEATLNSGRSAGTLTVALAAHLGVETAYLIGHDLAFKDGRSHGTGVAPMALEAQGKIAAELDRTNPNYYRRMMDVAKNGGGTLETMGLWDLFRSDMELITASHQLRTRFINLNISAGEGAVIAGTFAGDLPQPVGAPLDKSLPVPQVSDEVLARYKERCLALAGEFTVCEQRLAELEMRIAGWRPLGHSRAEIEALSEEMDITKLVSPGNSDWFAYVFRAALRNLMVRLHHNTFVRTIGERNWNQLQVMRLYLRTIPSLIRRLRPELDQALEVFR
jgi:hypothetical protein